MIYSIILTTLEQEPRTIKNRILIAITKAKLWNQSRKRANNYHEWDLESDLNQRKPVFDDPSIAKTIARIPNRKKLIDNALVRCMEQKGLIKITDLEYIQYLISNGANFRHDDYAAFINAAKTGKIDCVRYFLDLGADVHANFDEALKLAAINLHFDVVKVLVEQGADYHKGNNVAFRWAAMSYKGQFNHEITDYFLLELGMTVLPGTREWLVRHRCKHESELVMKMDLMQKLESKFPPKETPKAKAKKI